MSQPVISICIPTYNRGRYLRCLLEDCVKNIGDLKHSYEIIVSDNASADDTETVAKEFTGRLNLRYLKRDKNYGGHNNWAYLKRQARGTLQLYLADDDLLIMPQLSAIIDRMLADPELGVVFAPWKLYDRVEGKELGNFYPQEQEVTVEKGHFEKLLLLILKNHIFPEIYVVRSDLVRTAGVFTHPLAYWAFVHTAEYLSFGKILLAKEPFYVSVTRYFADEGIRDQAGSAEVQEGWDRYRGGLEYMLSRVPAAAMTPDKQQTYLALIQQFIAMRLHVALRMRIAAHRDPIDTYYLACRLKAMGYPQLLPIPFDAMRARAVVQYLLTLGGDKIVCAAELPPIIQKAMILQNELPVVNATDFSPEKYPGAVAVTAGSLLGAKTDHDALEKHRVRLLGIDDLLRKFS